MWRVWVRRRGCTGSWWGNRGERDHWGDLGIDGWIILGWISRRWDVGYVNWIGLAQDRNSWRTLVSAVMNLRVPWNAGNFLTSCKPVSFSRRTLHHGVSKYVCGRKKHLAYCPLYINVKPICFPSNFPPLFIWMLSWWQCGSRVNFFVVFKRFRLVDIGQTGGG